MNKVYLLCGLASSGKSTLARKIEQEVGATRLTLDERMLAAYDLTPFDEAYGPLVQQKKEQLWQEALQLLADGQDVILDWSLWNRAMRKMWSERIISAEYEYVLIYLAVPLAILCERLKLRNHLRTAGTHVISIEELKRFSTIFEPPSPDEGLNLEIIKWDSTE